MIKKRIIPILLYKDKGLVKSTNFSNYRFLGDPIQAVRVYNLRDVDELIFLDISTENQRPDYDLIDSISDDCFMPLTVGGGITHLEHIKKLLEAGADKVCISGAAINDHAFIEEAVATFGSQAVAIAINYRFNDDKSMIIVNPGMQIYNLCLLNLIETFDQIGVSEFVLTDVNREGLMKGYDLEFSRRIKKITNTPIVLNGGAGNYEHMLEAFNTVDPAAIAASSLFHFTEHTPITAKQFLKNNGINVRL